MVSRSGSSGKTGKGLGLGWATSGGLDGEIGAESTRDWVSVARIATSMPLIVLVKIAR